MAKKSERALGDQRPLSNSGGNFSHRINNSRMVGYAAMAVGLINLTYQGGKSGSSLNSFAYIALGASILLVSFSTPGKQWLQTKNGFIVVIAAGGLLVVGSFFL